MLHFNKMVSKLRLLTTPVLTTSDGKQFIPADKRGALLIYLAYHEDWMQREQVSFLFWPESDDKTARRNLRQLISRTKKLAFADTLEFNDQSLRWSITLDTTDFKKAIAEQNWEQAAKLYQGDFCESFSVADSNGFQDWLTLEREGYASAFAGAARQFSETLLEQSNYNQAAKLLKRALQQNDLAEDILQRYLQASYLDGQKDEALLMYKQFSERLKSELDLEPLSETQNIVNTIKQSESINFNSKSIQKTKPQQLVPLSVMRPPKIVGRQDIIDKVKTSEAQLIVLIGEAGVGKTRLIAELAPNACLIKAEESLRTIPFYAIVRFIKEQKEHPFEELGSYTSDLLRLIPELEPSIDPGPADAFTAKQRLLEALTRYFEAIAPDTTSQAGIAIAFDDIQWLDESSLELLVFLHNRNTLKLIATCRKYELTEDLANTLKSLSSAETIDLKALKSTDITTLLTQLIGSETKPELFASWLHKNTSGNIMFVLETLKSLFESGDLKADHEGWHSNLDGITKDYSELAIPKLVSELIQRRIQPLSEEVKRVLQGAAVVSKDYNAKLLSQITGLSQWSVLEALEQGQLAGVLDDSHFRHDLLRQSIYTNITINKKSFLHARVAETLDTNIQNKSSEDDIVIAEHWLAAQEEEKAATVMLHAARKQRTIGLQVEASKTLERTLAFALEQPLKHEIEYLLCTLMQELGQLDKAASALEILLPQSQDPNLKANIMCSQLTLLMRQGQSDKVESIFIELETLLEKHELKSEVKREIIGNRAVLAHHKGDYETSIVQQLECNKLTQDLGDKLALALGLSSLGAIYDYAGRYDDALAAYSESLDLSQRLNAVYLQQEVALNLVSCYTDMDRHDEAIEVGLKALNLGRYDATDFLRNNLAAAYFETNQTIEATKQYEQLVQETENNTLECNGWARLVALYSEQNLPNKQKTALKNALELAQKTDAPTAQCRIIVSCLVHGEDKDKIAARALLKKLDINSVPPVARAELEQVLQEHN